MKFKLCIGEDANFLSHISSWLETPMNVTRLAMEVGVEVDEDALGLGGSSKQDKESVKLR